MQAGEAVGEERDIGPEHDEGAVQQIDDVENAPDEREPDGDAGVEAAEHQAVGEHLKIDHLPRRAARAGALSVSPEAGNRTGSISLFTILLGELIFGPRSAAKSGRSPEDRRRECGTAAPYWTPNLNSACLT